MDGCYSCQFPYLYPLAFVPIRCRTGIGRAKGFTDHRGYVLFTEKLVCAQVAGVSCTKIREAERSTK